MDDLAVDAKRNVRLWEDADGRVAGLVRLRVGTYVEGQEADPFLPFLYGFDVRPDVRNLGLEDGMIAWACARARAVEETRGRRARITTGVPLMHPRLVAHRQPLLERHGFAPAGYCYFMRRPLHDPIPGPELPRGFTVRQAEGEADVERQVQLFTQSQRYPWTVQQHRAALADPDYWPDLDLIGIGPGGRFVGYCKCDILQESNARSGRKDGWVTELGTHPGFRHLGLERPLLLAGLHRLKAAGMDAAIHQEEMEVGGESLLELYESLGFTRIETTVFLRKDLWAQMYWSRYDAETNLRMTEEGGFDILRSEILPDTLDPETASNHPFLLAEKREAIL